MARRTYPTPARVRRALTPRTMPDDRPGDLGLDPRNGTTARIRCADCGTRLADGLVGTAWRRAFPGAPAIPWDVVPLFPVAQYGPPHPSRAPRCPDCYDVGAGTRRMDYVAPARWEAVPAASLPDRALDDDDEDEA